MRALPKQVLLPIAGLLGIALLLAFRACDEHAAECSATPSHHDAAATESAEHTAMHRAIDENASGLSIEDIAGRLLILRDGKHDAARFTKSGPRNRPGAGDRLRTTWHRVYNNAHNPNDDRPTIVRVDNARETEIVISDPACAMP